MSNYKENLSNNWQWHQITQMEWHDLIQHFLLLRKECTKIKSWLLKHDIIK